MKRILIGAILGVLLSASIITATTHYTKIRNASLSNSTIDGGTVSTPVVLDANGVLSTTPASNHNPVTSDDPALYMQCGTLGVGVTSGSYGHTYSSTPHVLVTGVGGDANLASASTSGLTVNITGSIATEWCAWGPY